MQAIVSYMCLGIKAIFYIVFKQKLDNEATYLLSLICHVSMLCVYNLDLHTFAH